jgi:hypothetical protein
VRVRRRRVGRRRARRGEQAGRQVRFLQSRARGGIPRVERPANRWGFVSRPFTSEAPRRRDRVEVWKSRSVEKRLVSRKRRAETGSRESVGHSPRAVGTCPACPLPESCF